MYTQFYYCPFTDTDADLVATRQKYEKKATCKVCAPSVGWRDVTRSTPRSSGGCLAYGEIDAVSNDMTVLVHAHGSAMGESAFRLKDDHGRHLVETGTFDAKYRELFLGGEPVITPVGTYRAVAEGGLYLTASQLALCMRVEGLPTSHRFVRVVSCWGAGTSTDKAAYDADDVFARRLASELYKLGYVSVQVGGYTAAHATTELGESVLLRGEEGLTKDDGLTKGDRLMKSQFTNAHGQTSNWVHWYDGRGCQTTKWKDGSTKWQKNPAYAGPTRRGKTLSG